jgi:hypothetical protein
VNSVLVEADGLVSAPKPPLARSARAQRGAAAIAGLLAAVALVVLPEPTGIFGDFSDEHLIRAHLDAWYGGDFETAQSFRAPERLRTGPTEERAEGEVEYQAMLGAHTELMRCEELPPETVRCEVAYSNALNEAVGKAPAIVSQQFGIRDGLLLFVAGPYLEDLDLTASFREYAVRSFPAEYEDACIKEPNYQPPECAALKLSHLGEWASWHLSQT